MTKSSGSFARARHLSVPLRESLYIAWSPSAPRNDKGLLFNSTSHGKIPGDRDSLRDFAIGITSFLFINVIPSSLLHQHSGTRLEPRTLLTQAQNDR